MPPPESQANNGAKSLSGRFDDQYGRPGDSFLIREEVARMKHSLLKESENHFVKNRIMYLRVRVKKDYFMIILRSLSCFPR